MRPAPPVDERSSLQAFGRLVLLVALVGTVAFAGDRLAGWAGHRLLLESGFRFSRLYRAELPAETVILGNSRAVNALLAPALEERTGRSVRSLAWNGLSAELAGVLWEDWLERHPPPELLLVEVGFVTGSNRQLGDFRPYYGDSPRLRALARRDAARSLRACSVARLYCLNSPLTLRAAWYARRSDQGWVNRYRISPALVAATDTLPRDPVDPILPGNLEALRGIVAAAEEAGAEVRLLWAPFLPAYRARLDGARPWLHQVEAAAGRPVLDLSGGLADPTYFSDRIHLNDVGARALADTLVARGFVGSR